MRILSTKPPSDAQSGMALEETKAVACLVDGDAEYVLFEAELAILDGSGESATWREQTMRSAHLTVAHHHANRQRRLNVAVEVDGNWSSFIL